MSLFSPRSEMFWSIVLELIRLLRLGLEWLIYTVPVGLF